MKKVILLSSLLVITGSAIMAQKTSFGFKAGVQQTALNTKIEGEEDDLSIDAPRTGFIIGGVANIQFSSNFSVQPNLLFNYRPSSLIVFGEGDVNIMSIDIPINLNYNHNGFFIGAGPNFSYGLSAKYKQFGDDETFNLYEEQDGEDAPFKRFEVGVNGQMGYQFPSGLTITGNFTRNFSNMLSTDIDEYKITSKQFGLSIGYIFNAKGKK